MLDTFAKRVNSQLVPLPGDIDAADRWAIGGRFRPTEWFAGAVVASLGALVSGISGTLVAPDLEDWTQGDRWRVELYPLPGDVGIYNRHAIAGHFLFEGTSSDDSAGALEVSLGGLTVDFVGTFTPAPARDGAVEAILGGLQADFVGSNYYDLYFDVGWSLAPTSVLQVLPKRDGAIAATLGGLAPSFAGTVLPPDSVSGRIAAALGSLTADFAGEFDVAPGRTGNIHANFGALAANFAGTAVGADSTVGAISATLGGLTADFTGTFAVWSTDGELDGEVGPVSASFRGAFIDASAYYGLLNGSLGSLTVSFSGTIVDIPGGPPGGDRTFKVERKNRTFVVPGRNRTLRV